MSDTPPTTNSTNSTHTTTSPTSPPPNYTQNDLTDLVKAIKFAYPEYGIRKVHREIIEVASQHETSLQQVSLGTIKTIWKKAGLSSSSFPISKPTSNNHHDPNSLSSFPTNPSSSSDDNDNDSILKLYTVGDGSILQPLTKRYDDMKLLLDASPITTIVAEDTGEWYHAPLNIPADVSGTKPHQALMNFNQHPPSNSSSALSSSSSSSKKEKNDLKNDVVKIQMAASIPGYSESMPMLLYNADRSIRTFLHPSNDHPNPTPPQNDDTPPPKDKRMMMDGYTKIQQLLRDNGKLGALGQSGGTKGYFQCRIYPTSQVVSIDVSSLVHPPPTW